KLDAWDAQWIGIGVGLFGRNVGNVAYLLALYNTMEARSGAGADHRLALPLLGISRWQVVKRNGTEAIALAQPQDAELGLTDARGILQHRLKYRLQIAGRRADDAQHLGGRGLLLQRLSEFLFQVDVGCAKAVNMSPGLRCLRTKTGNACSALRLFARQGHPRTTSRLSWPPTSKIYHSGVGGVAAICSGYMGARIGGLSSGR